MRYWVGVTDPRWFEFQATREFDELNFWQPSAKAPFTALDAGTPFLFKLKRPYNHIAGGGYFVKFSSLPLSLAWDAFGEKNGATSLEELERMIRPLLRDPQSWSLEIGCTVLTQPFFFKEADWIPAPEEWSSNIVRGKTFDTSDPSGKELWDAVVDRLVQRRISEPALTEGAPDDAQRYSEPFLSRSRLGQGAFRVLVTEAYKRRCAITGESTLPVLEAAHIKPFAQQGPNQTSNGLLLRSDFHKLFDLGLVTITTDHRIRVSKQIRDHWFNGKAYYRLDDRQRAVLPDDVRDRPAEQHLHWHSTVHFRG